MNSTELTFYITAIANAIACNYSNQELNLLGVALSQLSVTLTNIAAQRSISSLSDNTSTELFLNDV
ncbi:MAG: hypothetical protein MJ089_00630 [Ruminococcus sp.]|nr:hypothetical protein [Ruminococcus sp.]